MWRQRQTNSLISAFTRHQQTQVMCYGSRQCVMLSNHHTLCLHFICCEINGSILQSIASGSLGSRVTEFTRNGKKLLKTGGSKSINLCPVGLFAQSFCGPISITLMVTLGTVIKQVVLTLSHLSLAFFLSHLTDRTASFAHVVILKTFSENCTTVQKFGLSMF